MIDKAKVAALWEQLTAIQNDPAATMRVAVEILQHIERVDALMLWANLHTRARGKNVVVIWPIANRVFFDPSRELDVQFHGGRIQIPANAITAESGKPVPRAELRFTWFDVTNARDRAAASGDFSGRLADGTTRRLNSYGRSACESCRRSLLLDAVSSSDRSTARRPPPAGSTLSLVGH